MYKEWYTKKRQYPIKKTINSTFGPFSLNTSTFIFFLQPLQTVVRVYKTDDSKYFDFLLKFFDKPLKFLS